MPYLLRTESGYRLCYGEPKNPVVITGNGSYFCAEEYRKMVSEEKEVQAHALMESEDFPLFVWADVCENNHGLPLSDDIAEYLLEGKELAVDAFVEIAAKPSEQEGAP